MEHNEYQIKAMRTCNCQTKKDKLNHAIFGVISEYDELVEITTKETIDRADLDHMVKEAGDVFWMIAEACTAVELPFSEMEVLSGKIMNDEQRTVRMKLTGIMQKTYQVHDFDYQTFIGCLAWYYRQATSKIVMYLQCSREEALDMIMRNNIAKLEKRFPNGFEAERSIHRKAGDI